MEWISVKERLPENLEEVIITWVNHCPASYYDSIKNVPMTGFAVFHRDKWYWYTPTTRDMLAEYGRFMQAEIDEDIEVVAWMPSPEPFDKEQEQRVITEVCPHCGAENTIEWNTDEEGYTAYCPRCGAGMMLCDDCQHSPEYKGCDWDNEHGCYRKGVADEN